MATRSKTPRIPAQHGGIASGEGDAAPAKPKARRRASAGPAARQGREASPDPAGQPAAEMVAAAGAEREGDANPAAEAIKALGEMVAAGIDALAALRAEVQEVNRRLDRMAAGLSQPAATSDANEYSFGRERDPGDAVPPGVAAATPAPLTETDEAVLHTLEDLPKRTGRGKRGPRAKA